MTDNKSLESKIREVVGRRDRKRDQLSYVGRPNSKDPMDLRRQGEYKTKVIDEASVDVEEEYKDPDKHYAKQSKPMQDAINLHLRKGKSYWDAVRAAKVHVKEEAEQIDEVSKQTLGRYAKAAPKSAEHLRATGREYAKQGKDAAGAGAHGTAGDLYYKAGGMLSKAGKRDAMHAKAVDKLAKEEAEDLDEAKSSTLSLKAKQKAGSDREHKAKYGISRKRFAIKQEEPPTYSAADNKPRVMKKHKVDIHVHNTKTDKPHKYQDIVDAPSKHSAIFKTQLKYKKMGDKMGYVIKDVVHKGMVKEELELDEAQMPPNQKQNAKDDPQASKMITSPGKTEVDLKPTTDDRADADTDQKESKKSMKPKTIAVKEDTTMFKSDKNLGIPTSVIEEMAKALEEMKKMAKEQTHPKTDKEKKLAAMAEPKDKITHKDVLVGRGDVKEMSSKEKMKRGLYNKEETELDEKTLTPAEMKKREEVAQAIKRENPKMPMGKKMAIATATAKKVAEEAEQLDEIGDTPAGKKALGSYINKAAGKLHKSSFMIAKDKPENAAKHGMDAHKRTTGIQQATSRLTKEESEQIDEAEQLDEISKKTAFSAYAGKANDDYSKDYGEKLHGMIKKKWGKKAGDDAEAHASAQHFGRGGKSLGRDKLSTWNTPASSMRTTKSGKINKQDTKAKGNEIKSRLGSHPKAKLPEEVFSADELTRLDEIAKNLD